MTGKIDQPHDTVRQCQESEIFFQRSESFDFGSVEDQRVEQSFTGIAETRKKNVGSFGSSLFDDVENHWIGKVINEIKMRFS